MNPINISSAELRRLADIIEKREGLLEEVAKIDAQLGQWEKTTPLALETPAEDSRPSEETQVVVWRGRNPKAGRQPGNATKVVLEALKRHGRKGLKVRDLSELTHLPMPALYWRMQKLEKSAPHVKKVSPGRYAWVEAEGA